ncbi:MAG: response regulator [Myxococcales bacterium]|nr:response regulator [Myxococcales bacterium]
MRRAPDLRNHRSDPPIALLAEDDDELRALIARHLRRAGYDVIEAGTGRQLLELLVEHVLPPLDAGQPGARLVITDVRMPGRTGLEVLCLLRRVDVGIPIVIITAFGDPALHAEARDLGASAVLDKPLDLDALVDTARALAPL